jgi:ketosteroid isomerase-like protein
LLYHREERRCSRRAVGPPDGENPKQIGALADAGVARGVHDVPRMHLTPSDPSGAGAGSAHLAGSGGPLAGLEPAEQAARVFAALDAKDVETLVCFVSDDVRLRLGNAEDVKGNVAFAQAARESAGSIAATHHLLVNVWHDGDALICQLEVQYTRHDGQVVTLPCCNVFRVRNGFVADYQVYMDISPVYA